MRRFALVLLLATTALAQKRAITHEDVWLMQRISEPATSPDGRQVVFTLTQPDYDSAKQSADLWVVPADGSAPPRQITHNRYPEYSPAWSPDGSRIAFTARRDGDEATQIYVLPVSGGEAWRVTNLPAGVSGPKWSPDGKSILFQSLFDPIAEERKARKTSARIYDAMPVRYWNAWLDEKKPHLFVQAVEGGAPAVDLLKDSKLAATPGFAGLFSISGSQELHAVWAPDGRSVVFAATLNRHEMMAKVTESALFAVPVTGGEPRQLTPSGMAYTRPKFSPTGELFAIQEKLPVPGGLLYTLPRLVRLNWPNGGAPTLVTPEWDRAPGLFSFSKDGRTIYIEAEDDGFDQLFSVPARGGAVTRLYKVEQGGYTSLCPVEGGFVALYQTAAHPADLVRLNPAGAGPHALLTNFNSARVAQLDTPDPIHFWFTAKNGKRIHNIMYLPAAFDKGKRYPLAAFPHGGPASMSKDAFSTRWNSHLLASPGYVVLETNYTGSTGFGEKFADDIERDVLRGPAQELLEAIAEAGRRYPFIDLSRQAILGASYGGYLVNWLNGHTNQFKCIVSHAGAMNNESQYGVNDGGLERELRMGGPIWEKAGQWVDQSPIRYAGNFKTPTLITQGELDFRVPVNESLTTFKLLQRLGVPSRLMVFPDEGHWIQKGENSRAHMQEVLGWLKKYL